MPALTAPAAESAGARWIASISAQRSSREPCLVTCPRVTLMSDSRWRGVSPAHEHSWPALREPGHVADLGGDDRGEHRADAGQLLDHLVAAVTGQQVRDDLGRAW